MSFFGRIRGRGASGFGANSTAEEVTAGLDLSGKTYLITGANAGLGRETTRVLLARGARVIGTGRTAEKVLAAFPDHPANLHTLDCELTDPASIRVAAFNVEQLRFPLDGILANAGIMALPQLERVHGYEKQFFTNHVGHFLLITKLLHLLREKGRVVSLSSMAHQMAPRAGIQFDNLDGSLGYSPWRAYGQSKLANLLFARELSRRLEGSGRTANAVHPGVISTGLWDNLPPVFDSALKLTTPLFLKTVEQGAATSSFVLTHPSLDDVSGEYFADANVATSSKHGRDLELARKLWAKTEEIVGRLPRYSETHLH